MGEWSWEKLPDLSGKLAVVTGANSGLGFETTKMLTARGARVVMGCRSVDRAEEAQEKIKADLPYARLEMIPLDLADLSSVQKFAKKFNAVHDRLDILVNNAGVMAIPYTKTKDGFEMQLGTNHLGHFALTGLLDPKIKATRGARVIQVSSNAHKFGKMQFDDLQWEKGYDKWRAYGQSKLANLLFMFELSRRFRVAGRDTISLAAHPGYADTNLQMLGPKMENSAFGKFAMSMGNKYFAQSAEDGALPVAYAAGMRDVECGQYFGPSGFMEMKGGPAIAETTRKARSIEDATRLWEVSEELTGVKWTP